MRELGQLRNRGRVGIVAAVIAGLLLTGCGSGDAPVGPGGTLPPLGGNTAVTGSFLSAVAVGANGSSVPGTFQNGAIPSSGAFSAPTVVASGTTAQVVKGGALLLTVNSPQPVRDVLVGVLGQPGYFDVPVTSVNAGAGPQQYQIALPLSSATPPSSFIVNVATRGNSGFSGIASQAVMFNTTAQASSRLQVTLTWNAPVDMDLHVSTPAGKEIGYDLKQDPTGGMLDLDSNSSCRIDNVDNENVTWTTTAPSTGAYVIRPDLYSTCGQTGPFPYVITVNRNGVSQSFYGEFTAADADQNSTTATAPSRSHLVTVGY